MKVELHANLVKTVRKEVTSHVQVDTSPVDAAEFIRPTRGEEDVHLGLVGVDYDDDYDNDGKA